MGLWTKNHAVTLIPAIVIMILLTVFLRRCLKEKPLRVRIIPLQVIAVLLLLLEVGKQVVSLSRGYDLYHLPFHFCSLFIFALPLAAFYKGQRSQAVYEVVSSWCASLFLIMLIYPSLIYSEWDVKNFFTEYMSFHTVSFHNLVMLAALLIPALEIGGKEGRKHKAVLLSTCGFCVVSATMAQLLKTNFAAFYSCNIPAFEEVRLSLQSTIGPVAAQALYVSVVAVITILFVWMAYGLLGILGRKKLGRRNQNGELVR